MATATMTTEAEVEIKGTLYRVEAISPGEFGVSAVRVEKLATGESYDLIRTHANVVECSCPDFVCRHEGNGTVCKHGAAMIARGFLPAARPVAPITRQDRIRASYFGLKLPAAAPVVEAPAPVEVEAAPATGDVWMGETVALLLTGEAVEMIEAGATRAETDRLFDALEPAYRVDFHAFLVSIDCPAKTWAEWLALCLAGSPVAFEAPAFVLTPELDAERLGYELGNAGISADPPAELAPSCRSAFLVGLEAGRLDLERETLEDCRSIEQRDRDTLELLAGPVARWHEAELCQARSGSGHPSYFES